MNRKKKLDSESRKLKKLRDQNKRLREQNKKLRTENQQLEKKNRRLKAKVKRLEKRQEVQTKEEVHSGIYRYSIDYYCDYVEKNFRAEVYTDRRLNENVIRRQLEMALRQRVAENKDLSYLLRRSIIQGFEAEEVGINDAGRSQLNRIYCYIEGYKI